MMHFKCDECGKDIYAQNMIGTIPPHVHLPIYCSNECIEEATKKAQNNANDN